MLEHIPHDLLIKELRCLRMRLATDLSEKNISILREAERRLTGGGETFPVKIPTKKKRRPNKSEAFAKYLLK